MAQDILLDPVTLDVQIANGDFVVGKVDEQNVQLLLLTMPGQIRQSPFSGIGISQLINSEVSESELRHTINVQLKLDGVVKRKVTFLPDGNLNIEAEYGS